MNLLYHLFCIVFPEKCPYCERIIKSGQIACEDCMKKLDALQSPIIRGTYGYRCISSFVYAGAVRNMILGVKFRKKVQYLSQAAVVLAKDIREQYRDCRFDCITAVPLHKKDLARRGFNQSEILAKELSKLLNIPYTETLIKTKRTKKQHKCTYKERRTNLRGAFSVTDKALVKEKSLLVIDDIITSGATLGACCKTLNRAKPKLLCCATIANANQKITDTAII